MRSQRHAMASAAITAVARAKADAALSRDVEERMRMWLAAGLPPAAVGLPNPGVSLDCLSRIVLGSALYPRA